MRYIVLLTSPVWGFLLTIGCVFAASIVGLLFGGALFCIVIKEATTKSNTNPNVKAKGESSW